MEDNFEKRIRELIKDPPDYPFEEKLWKNLEAQMRKEKPRRRPLMLLTWLPLLLFSLISTGFAGYFYIKNGEAMARITAIENQLLNQQQAKPDSLIQKQITVVYDTIYTRTIIYQSQENQATSSAHHPYHTSSSSIYSLENERFARLAFAGSAPEFPTYFNRNSSILDPIYSNPAVVSQGSWSGLAPSPGFFSWNRGSSNASSMLQTPSGDDEKNRAWNNLFPLAPTKYQVYLDQENALNLPPATEQAPKQRKSVKTYLMGFKPTRFALAATGGTSTSLNFSTGKYYLNGGIRAEIGYGARFSLIFGMESINNSFAILKGHEEEEEEEEEHRLTGFPDIQPNDPDDVLHKIYGDFKYLQIPFGIKYKILAKGRFQPYVALGVISNKAYRSNLSYEYLSILEEYYINRNDLIPNTFRVDHLWATIGLQFNINKHWSCLLESSSQFQLKPGTYKYENLQLLKGNIGIQYQF